ncbi:MAG: hypothetical protein ABWY00_12655 [Dongiaceae bacterium]
MTRLRYPISALLGDYLRGLIGLAVSLVIVFTYDSGNRMIWLFVGLTLLFLAYTIRTALRQTTVIMLDDAGLTLSDWCGWRRERRIDWDRLRQMSLRYYAPRRAKRKGLGSVLGRFGGMRREAVQYGSRRDEAGPEDAPLSADGWLELSLRAQGAPVTIDSALERFPVIVRRAEQAALANGIDLDPITGDNLVAFGALADQGETVATSSAITAPPGMPPSRPEQSQRHPG